MDTPNDQQNNAINDALPEPISAKIRTQWAMIGLLVGIVSFMPITWLFLYTSIFISDLFGFNTNTDSFMVSFICAIPTFIGSLLCGVIGGESDYRRGRKYLGAILGGLFAPFIVLLFLSFRILGEWATH